jgi:chromosome segregation ATPase
LAEVRKDPESTPQAIREAEIALAEAKLSSKDAIDEQKEATDGLIESQSYLNELVNGAIIGSEFYTKFSEELTEAQKRQADAQDKLADAKDREAEAQERLNEALEKTAELIKKYPKVLGGMPNPMAITTGAETLATSGVYQPGGQFGMPNVNIEVNAGLGASGIEVGQEIEQYLKEYLNFTGGQFSFGSIGSIF